MHTARTSLGTIIIYDENPIAAGGNEGAVYKVTYPLLYAGYCVKIYHDLKRTAEREKKIAYMVKNKPSELETTTFKICWPFEMIVDPVKGKFIGFLMKLGFENSIKLSELTRTRISKKLDPSWNKFNRMTLEGSKKRLQICVNIASAIFKIHTTGKYSIVDYKPENMLISITGKISILDVDSFQIAENTNVLFHSAVLTPEYKPQESKTLNPASHHIPESWDRFSLAVSFYQILFGIHPHTGTARTGTQYEDVSELGDKIQMGLFVHGSKKNYFSVIPPPHHGFNNLSPAIQKLFIKTFEDGHTNPNLRPSAETWGKIIYEELVKNTAVKKPFEHPSQVIVKQTTLGKPVISQISMSNVVKQNPITQTNNNTGSVIPLHPAVPSNPVVKKQINKKKEDYMPWKIATVILIIILVWLLYKNSENVNHYQSSNRLTDSTMEALSAVNNDFERTKALLYQSQTEIDTLQQALIEISSRMPLLITNMSFNGIIDGQEIKQKSHTFTRENVQYIQPVIEFKPVLSRDSAVKISYDIYNPQGSWIKTSETYSSTSADYEIMISGSFSNIKLKKLPATYISNGTEILTGSYIVDVWCNNMLIIRDSFAITEY